MRHTGDPADPHERHAHRSWEEFEAFTRLQRPRLEQWYRRRGLSPEDAADVAQEALASLAQRWLRLKTEEDRRRFYFTITTLRYVDFLRKHGRRVDADVFLDDEQTELVADEGTTNPAVMFAGGTETPLSRAVDELSSRQREALLRRVVEQMSYDDMARVSGRTENALRQDVARALRWLRRVLNAGVCVLAGWAVRARRVNLKAARATVASGSATSIGVVSHAALLGLLVTSPLYVLPAGSAVAQSAAELPRLLVEHAPRPVAATVRGLAGAASPAGSRRLGGTGVRVVTRLVRRPKVSAAVRLEPAVKAPQVCVRKRCGTGARVTVRVLRYEVTLPGHDGVESCAAFPEWAEPHVTCSEGDDPP